VVKVNDQIVLENVQIAPLVLKVRPANISCEVREKLACEQVFIHCFFLYVKRFMKFSVNSIFFSCHSRRWNAREVVYRLHCTPMLVSKTVIPNQGAIYKTFFSITRHFQ